MYSGYTHDLKKRYQEHCEGKGAKYTRSFKPIRIAQAWQVTQDKTLAMKIEAYVKSLNRKEKEALLVNPESLTNVFGRELVTVAIIGSTYN